MRKETRLRFSKERKGAGNPCWMGDLAAKTSIHCWVRGNFIDPKKCEHCGCKNRKLDWSNKNHTYSRNRKDWQRLCRGCHRKYDIKVGLVKYPKKKWKYKWSADYERCKKCSSNNISYKAFGMCHKCYRVMKIASRQAKHVNN